MSGYVRIHRDLIGHPAFRSDAEAMAFAWMIVRAQWKPVRVRYKDRILSLQRGQLAISVRDFAAAMDRDKAWVERLFKRLAAETMIETRSETGVSVITICNYDNYQAETETRETVDETPRETDARQTRDTEQRREEVKEESTPLTPRAGGRRGKTRLSPDWKAPEIADLPPKARACAEQWTMTSYETHAEAFGSYWRGAGKMMTDWDATWANRIVALHSQVMRDQKFGNAPTASPSAAAPSGKQWTAEEQRAHLAKLERFGLGEGQPPPPAANREPTSFGKPIGHLLPRAGTA
jgi:DNA-binding transcriptional regulator YhcF (GntR family)